MNDLQQWAVNLIPTGIVGLAVMLARGKLGDIAKSIESLGKKQDETNARLAAHDTKTAVLERDHRALAEDVEKLEQRVHKLASTVTGLELKLAKGAGT